MARAQRSADLPGIEPQGALCRYPDRGSAYDEEMMVHKGKVIGPVVVAWIEEAQRVASDPVGDPLFLAHLAERAGPRDVVEMLGSAPARHARNSRSEAIGRVGRPQGRRDHMVDMKRPRRREEAVCAYVACTQPHHLPDQIVVRIMALGLREMPEQRRQARLVRHRV